MLESLKKVGAEIGKELNRAWENLAEGWRELLSRSGDALTHFTKRKEIESVEETTAGTRFPSWALLAGELKETKDSIVVRLEVPGMEKEDCAISIEGNTLYVRGEKRFQREADDGVYHVMERAYGSFQRAILLPHNVDADNANAAYENGVLTVTLPKTGSATTTRIEVK
ncbi:MAG: Hsp20/alpha crystallin family protein [Gammaproteobacteria bacterium]